MGAGGGQLQLLSLTLTFLLKFLWRKRPVRRGNFRFSLLEAWIPEGVKILHNADPRVLVHRLIHHQGPCSGPRHSSPQPPGAVTAISAWKPPPSSPQPPNPSAPSSHPPHSHLPPPTPQTPGRQRKLPHSGLCHPPGCLPEVGMETEVSCLSSVNQRDTPASKHPRQSAEASVVTAPKVSPSAQSHSSPTP